MNKIERIVLETTRKVYKKIILKDGAANDILNHQLHDRKEEGCRIIKNRLADDKPLMIARFGATEMHCLANYHSIINHKDDYRNYIKSKFLPYWWDDKSLNEMSASSGFFPSTPEMLERFAQLMINDMKEVDVLATWLSAENLYAEQLSNATKVNFGSLIPYNFKDPWSQALENKTVLVIHPFEDSIQAQYKKRELLFKDKKVLPQFELKTLKAVQSIVNTKTPFNNWFEALDYMKEKIDNTTFDIAILGCGAYGFPLAAHIKRLGKKAVHLGGPTQVLFGIVGRRWEAEENNKHVTESLVNEHWVRPLPSETPQGFKKMESGAYW